MFFVDILPINVTHPEIEKLPFENQEDLTTFSNGLDKILNLRAAYIEKLDQCGTQTLLNKYITKRLQVLFAPKIFDTTCFRELESLTAIRIIIC